MRISNRRSVVLLAILLLGACAADIHDANSGGESSSPSREVLVRLCADTSVEQAKLMLSRRSLWINNRLSVNLLTLEWSDERSVSDVLSELEGVSGICTAQPNYGYDIAPADQGAPR